MQEKSLTIRERDWKLSRSWNRSNRAGVTKESKGGRREEKGGGAKTSSRFRRWTN